ncbi:S8 family serine peptidase [Micromonospora sp. KC723]|uniref:S8 family serine peptidase n=1 Tax=Micromonospora sp. KC723 TaxID=2530381 RepID=UPI0010518ACD|nr:S8 family serine peptidase [Micromonospora sp. KC723]TDB72631.1 peptidase S8 [Micromonospora sp. KC723]
MTLDEEDPLHHRRRRTAALGLAIGLAVTTPAAASAAAPAGSPTARPAVPPATATGKHIVTLVTGDRVTVTAGGKAAVQPGPGREKMQFLARRERGHLSVVPQDAAALIRANRVDPRLFDVTGLIDAGYDDARRDDLPLLVAYGSGAARRGVAALPGARVTRDLPAIGGAAVTAGKASAAAVWSTVTTGSSGARLGAAGGVERIWLDGRRQPTLDHTVPQIGAPAAWSAGLTGRGVTVAVLDTGVDATHPDLAGKVAEARNFSEVDDNRDTVGHGTHVASTIAGSGAASGGRYKGVAPDAVLLDGKVCEDSGCSESAILAGMQWAAVEKRAAVINMSLGGRDTPEIDPLEEAVGTLTEQTGTLFVIAAGNDGADGSVGSPASADAALAVGAVDRADDLADFSSRGPRVGDDALKPEITAPGVDVVAARSAHGQIGDPVGERYVTLSGTSMATPHVAGSAALLAQRHPAWKAGQLKSTLMAAAKPHPAQTAYQQGAGRVDVARAITQQVTSDPASVSFGRTLWPHHDDAPVTRKVSWRNTGPAPVTLDLTVQASGPDGKAAPSGMFTLGAQRITVPAGGHAETTVTVDTRLGDADGYWTGRVLARSGTTVAVTPLAVHREVESYTLTIKHLGRAGTPDGAGGSMLVGLASFGVYDIYAPDGVAEVRVPKGRYGLNTVFIEPKPDGETAHLTQLSQPELLVDRDQEITVDVRRSAPVRMTVPRADAKPALAAVNAEFRADDGSSYGFGLLADSFADLATGQLGGTVSADRFVTSFDGQWAELGGEHSPYLYAVSEAFPGRLPTGLVRNYRKAELATVKHTFRDIYPGLEAERLVFPHNDYNTGGWAIVLPTDVPGERVEHYSTNKMRWTSELRFGHPSSEGPWLDTQAILESPPTAYKSRRTVGESWGVAPLGPSALPTRWIFPSVGRFGDTIFAGVPMFSDAAGHTGASVTDKGRTALWRNGKLVGETDGAGYGEFEVPAAAADYKLTVSATRSLTDLGTAVESTWTFRSTHTTGEKPVALPVSAIGFRPRLAADNSAPAGQSLTIPVDVRRQDGAGTARVKSLTVDASYDGGKTWVKAGVVHVPRHGWAAVVKHPAAAGYVSLRASAQDTDGNTVTTRIIQAYRLR